MRMLCIFINIIFPKWYFRPSEIIIVSFLLCKQQNALDMPGKKKTKYHVITDIHAMQYMFDCKKKMLAAVNIKIFIIRTIRNADIPKDDVGSREFPL